MELYHSIIEFIDVNIISCLIPLIFTIILIELIFKKRFKTKQVLNLVRGIVISYTIITTLYFITGIVISTEKSLFLDRATGTYRSAYWFMFFCSSVLPFTLFYKKLGLRPFYLIFIALFMKFGWYFERYVIFVTSFQSDYLPSSEGVILGVITNWILMLFLQGFLLAILALGFFEFIDRNEKQEHHKIIDL